MKIKIRLENKLKKQEKECKMDQLNLNLILDREESEKKIN